MTTIFLLIADKLACRSFDMMTTPAQQYFPAFITPSTVCQ
jgi:hypothetical protein